jgi:hypothetical protein
MDFAKNPHPQTLVPQLVVNGSSWAERLQQQGCPPLAAAAQTLPASCWPCIVAAVPAGPPPQSRCRCCRPGPPPTGGSGASGASDKADARGGGCVQITSATAGLTLPACRRTGQRPCPLKDFQPPSAVAACQAHPPQAIWRPRVVLGPVLVAVRSTGGPAAVRMSLGCLLQASRESPSPLLLPNHHCGP